MCGIAGFLRKNSGAPLGSTLISMLAALSRRGPDSTGVAIWLDEPLSNWLLRVKLGEPEFEDSKVFAQRAEAMLTDAELSKAIVSSKLEGPYARLTVDSSIAIDTLTGIIEGIAPEMEIVSCGHTLEIVKQVGSPQFLDDTFGVSNWTGTHGI